MAVSPATPVALVEDKVNEATGPPSLHVTAVDGLAAETVDVSVPFTSSQTLYLSTDTFVTESTVRGNISVDVLESLIIPVEIVLARKAA